MPLGAKTKARMTEAAVEEQTNRTMKTIFECETEVGRCENGSFETEEFLPVDNTCVIYTHTVASLTGLRRMLKIEQRCFLRREAEILGQSWIRPEIMLEPASGSETELITMARDIHAQFTSRARREIPESCLAPG